MTQLKVRVVDVFGRPQKGVRVEVHRADLVSAIAGWTFVASSTTDDEGYAYFDGLWPWKYAIVGIREEDDFQTTVEFIDIAPFQEYEVTLKGSVSPHKYRLVIECKTIPAGFVEWFVDQLRSRIEELYPVDITKVYATDNCVVVEYTIHHPVSTWAIALIALAIAATVVSIMSFFVVKIFPEAVPREAIMLFAIGAAALGVGYLVSSIKR